MPIKLVVFDLDKTIWDHPNESSLKFPLKLVNPDCVEDANSSRVTLLPEIRQLLQGLKSTGKTVSIASWNHSKPVLELLNLFNLKDFFTFPQIKWDIPKGEMIERIVNNLKLVGVEIKEEEILFVDDNDKHIDAVKSAHGKIRIAKAWLDPKSPRDLLEEKWIGRKSC